MTTRKYNQKQQEDKTENPFLEIKTVTENNNETYGTLWITFCILQTIK